jgi:hypothetical protein
MLDSLRPWLVRRFKAHSREEKDRFMARASALQMSPYRWLVDLPASLIFGANLKMLATIYFTDKWNGHWYAQHYEDAFRNLRRRKINILEIGIGGYKAPRKGGGSLRMWRTYFPHGHVYGVDIWDKSPHSEKRITIFQGSQADPEFLDRVVHEIGKIDIIVDDGSHQNEHVLFSFQHLFPHLADGGIYVVEDTETSYWQEAGGNEVDRNDCSTSMGYFKSLVDGLNWEQFRGTYHPTYFDLNIKSIAFYHNLIFIRKGTNHEGQRAPD